MNPNKTNLNKAMRRQAITKLLKTEEKEKIMKTGRNDTLYIREY